jgi:hypothetical protein
MRPHRVAFRGVARLYRRCRSGTSGGVELEHPALPFIAGVDVVVRAGLGGEDLSDGVVAEVAAMDQPLRRSDRPGASPRDRSGIGWWVDPDDVGAPDDLPVEPPQRDGASELGPVVVRASACRSGAAASADPQLRLLRLGVSWIRMSFLRPRGGSSRLDAEFSSGSIREKEAELEAKAANYARLHPHGEGPRPAGSIGRALRRVRALVTGQR